MWHALAHLQVRLGRFAEARELAARSDAVLRGLGQSYEAAILSELIADVELVAGDADAAVEALRAGSTSPSAPVGRASCWRRSCPGRAMAAGQPILAEGAAEQAVTGGGWIRAIAEGVLGRVRAGQGRHDDAERLSLAAVDYFEGTDFLTFHARARLDRAEVLWRSGRWDAAIDAVERARTLHEQKGSPVEVAQAERALAELVARRPLEATGESSADLSRT